MEQESQKRKLDEIGNGASNVPVFCANNCGFFGSENNNNLCSKCYKDFLLKKLKTEAGGTTIGDERYSGGDDQDVDSSPHVKEVVAEVKQSQVEQGTTSENPEKGPANRCNFCKKRVGLTGFKCRCGHTFCSMHRYSNKHNCVFDYKSAGQDAIAKANPLIKTEKVDKI